MRRWGRWLVAVGALVLGVGALIGWSEPAAAYGTISSISASPTSRTIGASTTWTFGFTTQNIVPKNGGRITLEMYGLNGAGNMFTNATLKSTTSPSSLAVYSRYGNTIVLSTTAEIAGGTTFSVVLENVTNPTIGGYYAAHVYTTNYGTEIDGTTSWGGDYLSSYVQIGTNTNVKGQVTKSGSSGVPFANFHLYNSNYSTNYYGYADKDGNWGIGSVPAGTYTFRVYSPPNYSTGSTATVYAVPDASTVTVASSGVVTKNVSFAATPKTLSGTVKRSNGTAISGANIWVSGSTSGGYGYASAKTDSSGNYSFFVPGGIWSVGTYSSGSSDDWTVCGTNSYQSVSFSTDASSESKSANFTATSLSSSVKGKFTKPDGSAPSQYSVGMSLQNADNCYFGASVDSAGTFSVKVSPGTYTVGGWVSDSTYSFPTISQFTVTDSETKDLGTMKLIEKTDQITGTVKDNKGGAVSGASVSAWKDTTSGGSWDWANVTTLTDGSYTLKVTPGTWKVSAWPSWSSSVQEYVTDGTPATVEVKSGVTATQNFTFQKCTNTLTGRILDPDGNVLTSLSGWVGASDGAQPWSNVGSSVTNGTFTMKLPSGTWNVNLYVYSSDYSTGDVQKITFAGDNESKSVDLKLLKNDATIKGTIYDDAGNKVTNRWLSIYATKGQYASWQNGTLDTTAGTYTIKVSAGTWRLGWWIDQSLGYSAGTGQDVEVEVKAGETKTYDISLKKADATIKGKATKSDGSAMPWAWITADTRDPNEKTSADTYFYSNGASTNTNGNYMLAVPAGTYWVGGSMWMGSGVINPKRTKVTVKKDETATVDLVFRTADATIAGTVKKDGVGTNAFVTGWSEDGGYAEANSNNAGTYGLSVSSGTEWHIRAMKKDGSNVYKSKEAIVDLVSEKKATVNLELAKQEYTLPAAKTTSFDPTKQQAITLDDGTSLTIPANTIATSGTVTLTAEPKAELAEEADAKPVAYGYDLNVVDQNGTQITNFNGTVTLETKYEEGWLDDAKVQNEDELIVGYYDESVGTWKELSSCTVNDDKNTVTCQVDHFTEFAIITASDTTPPSAPTEVALTDKGTGGAVSLSWKNPSDADFAGVTIYRGAVRGEVGSKIGSSASKTATSYDDTGLTNGTEYFYTLRAADASGNESTNSSQVAVTPSSSGTATTSTLPKTGPPSPQASGGRSRPVLPVTVILAGGILGLVALTLSRRRRTPVWN